MRAIIILVSMPLLRRSGYGLTWQEAVVLLWSGLRGAVGLALSMFLLLDNLILDIRYRTLCFFFMGMIAVRFVEQGFAEQGLAAPFSGALSSWASVASGRCERFSGSDVFGLWTKEVC